MVFSLSIHHSPTTYTTLFWLLSLPIPSYLYEYQNEIIFGDLKNKDFYTVNVISYNEESINKDTGEITITNFSYVTSLEITSKNKAEIISLGRRRWKIENKGFKEQKSDILNITHIYTKKPQGTKKSPSQKPNQKFIVWRRWILFNVHLYVHLRHNEQKNNTDNSNTHHSKFYRHHDDTPPSDKQLTKQTRTKKFHRAASHKL